ncbi:CoA-substrate-specific enzyme activase, putative [Archaeoglobus sulfaticallidus PM70-1]|uniref:CoA-substrate-specific enzyme activase, putative n=1 Tax=Archaeoglobus sulfaticallidus PM70-1 TaxID=387631 RepID=N0BLI5_9EURY|nr:acyl-CoA dehydratase activase [Archaeoglobus sulfaticallidus]AGK61055.1 CoA-substrate-specific enzyme activase, putative [Archaeoglobus sulfaticallidus PM70-1]
MYSAGIDIGSLATKVCIVDERKRILAYRIKKTSSKIMESGLSALEECLSETGLRKGDLDVVVATGYGRNLAVSSFADFKITEITCHARGAKELFLDCRTVIDIGGQDSKAISIDENGMVVNFTMNDKCAAGTGRFLEVMANVLGLDINEMGELSLRSEREVNITSTCTVFAESEVISLLSQGENEIDILAGINRAIAKRVASLARHVGVVDDVVMTGGVAKNAGVVKALEEELSHKIHIPDEPQIIGAYGAGVLGLQKAGKRR